MRKKIIQALGGVLLGLLGANNVYAQASALPALRAQVPSPTSAELGRYGDVPVSLYTGVPSVSVPIYTITSQGYSLPLSLSYMASGIRVDQEASNVGLGWALNAGGVITRAVRDEPDDIKYGFINSRSLLYANIASLAGNYVWDKPVVNLPRSDAAGQYLLNITRQRVGHNYSLDSQADIFMFNFAGKSGKIVFDGASPKILDGQDMRVEIHRDSTSSYHNEYYGTCTGYIVCGSIVSWKIVDGNGYAYVFDRGEMFSGPLKRYPGSVTYFTSWYLSKILNPIGEEVLSISYDHGLGLMVQPYSGRPESHLYLKESSGLFSLQPGSAYNQFHPSSFSQREVYIDSIRWSGGSAKFSKVQRPEGSLPGYARYNYDEIVFRRNGQMVSSFKMGHSYFEADPASGIAGSAELYRTERRLRLDWAEFRGSNGTSSQGRFTFDYYGNGPVYGSSNPRLPRLNSKAMDHWGYYNGALSNDGGNVINAPPDTFRSPRFPGIRFKWPDTNPTSGLHIYQPGNRETDPTPDGVYMRAGSLRSIAYPSGGTTRFEYEPNQVSAVTDSIYGYSTPLGGGAVHTDGVYTTLANSSFEVRSSTGTARLLVMGEFNNVVGGCGGIWPTVKIVPIVDGVVKDRTVWQLQAIDPGGGGFVWISMFGGTSAPYSQPYERVLSLSPGKYSMQAQSGGACNASLTIELADEQVTPPRRVGGLRIKRIVSNDGLDPANDVIKEYDYSGDQLYRLGIQGTLSSGRLMYEPRYMVYDWEGSAGNEIIHLYSSDRIMMGSGSHIGYAQVGVRSMRRTPSGSLAEISKEVSFFLTSAGDYHRGALVGAADLYGDYYRESSYTTSYDWRRGLLLKQLYLDASGNVVREMDNRYSVAQRGSFPSLDYHERVENSGACAGSPCYYITHYNLYDITYGDVRLLSSRVTNR